MLDLGIPERRAKSQWPNLHEGAFQHTSEVDRFYNCVAWAARDKMRWWQPSGDPAHYWPAKATLADTIDAYMEAFGTRHYTACEDGSFEIGYEKIAIYWNQDGFQHVARQREDDCWTSKLGEVKDIAHDDLNALSGEYYGHPVRFMKRRRAVTKQKPKRMNRRQRATH